MSVGVTKGYRKVLSLFQGNFRFYNNTNLLNIAHYKCTVLVERLVL